eukprot:6491000-Ditylum_brightwellii.AAC.1
MQKGRRQAKKDISLRSLRIKRHSATIGRSNETWENDKHMDAEMEPVEETELDILMLEEKHTKAPKKRDNTAK